MSSYNLDIDAKITEGKEIADERNKISIVRNVIPSTIRLA
jgi:hypothetical protein